MSGFGSNNGFGPSGGAGLGSPPGGGGGYGGPPNGGEAPLSRIDFSPEDEKNLSLTAKLAKVTGMLAIVLAVISLLANLVQILIVSEGSTDSNVIGSYIGQGCGFVLAMSIAAVLAFFLFRVSKAVQRVVDTDDADQDNLVEALKALRGYFMVKGILYILVLLFACAFAVLGVALSAAILGAMQ